MLLFLLRVPPIPGRGWCVVLEGEDRLGWICSNLWISNLPARGLVSSYLSPWESWRVSSEALTDKFANIQPLTWSLAIAFFKFLMTWEWQSLNQHKILLINMTLNASAILTVLTLNINILTNEILIYYICYLIC